MMKPQELHALRVRYGMSLVDASALIGVAHRSWRAWEDGERNCPEPIQRLLCLFATMPAVRTRLRGMCRSPSTKE